MAERKTGGSRNCKTVNNTAADTDRLGMITEEMLQEYGCDRLEFKKTGQTALDEDGDPLESGCFHLQLDPKRNRRKVHAVFENIP